MAYDHCTMLSREGAASLKAHCSELGYDGDLYGDPLNALVGGFPDSWLEPRLCSRGTSRTRMASPSRSAATTRGGGKFGPRSRANFSCRGWTSRSSTER